VEERTWPTTWFREKAIGGAASNAAEATFGNEARRKKNLHGLLARILFSSLSS